MAADRTGRASPLAAVVVAVAAFALYRSTLLPGLDFGDTASFQTVAGSSIVSARDGYPLYFAVAGVLVRLIGGEPAHALNLVSAIEAAIACGLLTLVGAELSGSILGAVGAALLFAGSYTFWSQAVIAEVYALHMLLVALTLWLLLRWEARPRLTRLSVFFAVYALAFGNHLSMILLAPAYTAFLLLAAPHGWRSMLRPRVVLLAAVCAAAGALPYLWNLRSLWLNPFPPPNLIDGLSAAWFDITKSDWRETMVMNVPAVMMRDHASMYLFDLRQQFGWIAVALAPVGLAAMLARGWRRAVLVLAVYVANALFAFGYNVGDTHVFYVPSHAAVALLCACGVAALARRLPRPAASMAAILLIAYAGARIYTDYPALDRSHDRRPIELLTAMTSGLDDRRAILLTDLNWQVENGLTYFGQRVRPDVAHARMLDVLLYAPALVGDNQAVEREIAVTARARALLARAWGPLIPTAPDPRAIAPPMAGLVNGLAPGTPYVLTILKPTRDATLDGEDLARAVTAVTGGQVAAPPQGDYAAIAGRVGEAPSFVAGSSRPFRNTLDIGGMPVTIRMDSWLAADTIRRMGFGHVIAGRRHTLIVERGVSFVAFDATGSPVRRGYAAGIFEPQPRYLCYR